jgi:hypothetical protein
MRWHLIIVGVPLFLVNVPVIGVGFRVITHLCISKVRHLHRRLIKPRARRTLYLGLAPKNIS